MDLMASCKEKLGQFRIKELKDVLTQLSLSKQGRKQDLVDRIILTLSVEPGALMPGKKNVIRKEDVAKLIDDTYRKMQGNGANDLATKAQAVSNCSNNVVVCKEEIEDSSYKIDKVRCPCGSTSQTESMIKCEDSRCHIWQHIKCVIIPEKPMEGVLPKPPDFFHCELCRLTRTDPFLVTISHPLYPVKLAITSVPTDGSNPVLSAEKNFQLTKLEKNLILKQEYDVQAWCMLLNDKVPFRLQWPQYADLQVNGMPVRAINRPGSQLLGTNGRDDGPIITTCTRDGINKISLTGCDTRVFCLGVRIVKRRTVQQIMNIIPSESNGELFEDAITRIRRCVGGGTAMENAESDSDIEVVAHFVTVSLRCPMSGSRMKVAGRFKPCVHMGCFDLDVFVEMNQRSRKWQCPVCLKNYSLENVIIDPYFNRITSKLRECGEDLTEIEVKPDGSWRGKGGSGEIGMWHNPDSSLCVSTEVDSKPTSKVMREVKQENSVLKLGMRKNENGIWEFRHKQQQGGGGGVDSQMLSSGGGNIGQGQHDVIQMSSSVSGSGVKDCDDVSVNQDRNNDVIVLSDSDDDEVEVDVDVDVNPPLNSTSTNNNNNQYSHEIPEIYLEDPVTSTVNVNVNGNGNDDEYAMHMWTSLPPNVGQQGLDLFASDDINFPPLQSLPLGDFTTETNTNNVMGDSSSAEPNDDDDDMCDGLVSNSSLAEAFDTSDPSLQMYLPPPLPPLPPLTTTITTTRQQSEEEETDLTFQPQIPSEDWISLRLGGDNNTNPSANAATNGEVDEEGTLDSLAHTASLLGGGSTNDDNNNNNNKNVKQSRQRSDGPFSFPQKRRSVRPRYLSIDSDSD